MLHIDNHKVKVLYCTRGCDELMWFNYYTVQEVPTTSVAGQCQKKIHGSVHTTIAASFSIKLF